MLGELSTKEQEELNEDFISNLSDDELRVFEATPQQLSYIGYHCYQKNGRTHPFIDVSRMHHRMFNSSVLPTERIRPIVLVVDGITASIPATNQLAYGEVTLCIDNLKIQLFKAFKKEFDCTMLSALLYDTEDQHG